MSKTSIPTKVQAALWARAGGRCQYRGCNEDLVGDLIAGRQDGTFGFIAHIVADIPGGPRGDPIRSLELSRKPENLMLMCARHHKQIDVEAVNDHSESVLLAMKAEHERRISIVTAIDHDRASHVLRFAANIGENEALVSTRSIFSAMSPNHFPASGQAIDLELVGCAFRDNEPAYWALQRENLRRQFQQLVRGRIERQEIRHLSVFALAPQPLLIELGCLLCDIVPATVYQRHREPSGWRWGADASPISFRVGQPNKRGGGPVALKLAVSATVADDRLRSVLGADVAIWSLCADEPHNDILRCPEDQMKFRQELRWLYDRIKAAHGEDTLIHVFPILPASLAVEVGRVRMPKSELSFRLYDNRRELGFIPTFDVC